MSQVAAHAPELTADHVSWLLVTAYNYLQQDLSDQAVTLLEFLRTFDPNNIQCIKMLAYGYFLQGETEKSAELIDATQRLLLTEKERSGIRLLQSHILRGRPDN